MEGVIVFPDISNFQRIRNAPSCIVCVEILLVDAASSETSLQTSSGEPLHT